MLSAAALLFATQAAVADVPVANAALVALYDSACVSKAAPGAEFQPVTAEDMPRDVAHLYIGPQEGRYWRRSGPIPAFVALTRGPGHWGGIEEFCVVGVRGGRFDVAAATFVERFDDRTVFGSNGNLQTWERWGTTNLTVHDRRDHRTVLVTQRPDAWVSLLTGGVVTATGQH